MNLSIDGKMRNYIFLGLVGVTIIWLIISFSVAAQQDKAYRLHFLHYQQATQLMGQQKYAQAEEILTGLDQDSRASCQVVYALAICAENTGDLAAADQFMQQVREIRPAYLMDQGYLEQYGKILYLGGSYERAKFYLLESQKYPANPEISREAEKYLAEIVKKQEVAR